MDPLHALAKRWMDDCPDKEGVVDAVRRLTKLLYRVRDEARRGDVVQAAPAFVAGSFRGRDRDKGVPSPKPLHQWTSEDFEVVGRFSRLCGVAVDVDRAGRCVDLRVFGDEEAGADLESGQGESRFGDLPEPQ